MDHDLPLPGFRFHPTEEELLDFYLKNRVQGKKLPLEVITTVHLYRFDPWELPGMARIGEKEWYFYVPRDHRKPGGGRPSRTTERGFWKATGCDRPVRSAADPKRLIGLKKTLVYYEGRAPRGSKTEWVMNEYRLPGPPATSAAASASAAPQEDIVLCKIHRKAASMKELEQQAAAAAAMEDEAASATTESPPISHRDEPESFDIESIPVADNSVFLIEDATASAEDLFAEEEKECAVCGEATTRSWRPSLPELEVPRSSGLEWLQQDPVLSQTRSPWLVDFWSPSFVSMLNC